MLTRNEHLPTVYLRLQVLRLVFASRVCVYRLFKRAQQLPLTRAHRPTKHSCTSAVDTGPPTKLRPNEARNERSHVALVIGSKSNHVARSYCIEMRNTIERDMYNT